VCYKLYIKKIYTTIKAVRGRLPPLVLPSANLHRPSICIKSSPSVSSPPLQASSIHRSQLLLSPLPSSSTPRTRARAWRPTTTAPPPPPVASGLAIPMSSSARPRPRSPVILAQQRLDAPVRWTRGGVGGGGGRWRGARRGR
jgi:hypothetical protein